MAKYVCGSCGTEVVEESGCCTPYCPEGCGPMKAVESESRKKSRNPCTC